MSSCSTTDSIITTEVVPEVLPPGSRTEDAIIGAKVLLQLAITTVTMMIYHHFYWFTVIMMIANLFSTAVVLPFC